jgi:hypothetical protein
VRLVPDCPGLTAPTGAHRRAKRAPLTTLAARGPGQPPNRFFVPRRLHINGATDDVSGVWAGTAIQLFLCRVSAHQRVRVVCTLTSLHCLHQRVRVVCTSTSLTLYNYCEKFTLNLWCINLLYKKINLISCDKW